MNKLLSICVVLCLWIPSVNGQTYYYKLTKEIKGGTTNTNVTGGQFITFNEDKCFESDKYGQSVGNGVMKYDRYYSTQFKTYTGTCYYGTNAFFRFNSDKTLLNIESNAGKIYVYRMATPPSGVTTCSLIRKPSNSSGGGSYVPSYPVQPTYPIGGNTGGGIGNGGNAGGGNNNQQRTGHQCRVCGGNGMVIKEPYLGNTSGTKCCSECNKSVYIAHYHTRCQTCGGDGWIDGY